MIFKLAALAKRSDYKPPKSFDLGGFCCKFIRCKPGGKRLFTIENKVCTLITFLDISILKFSLGRLRIAQCTTCFIPCAFIFLKLLIAKLHDFEFLPHRIILFGAMVSKESFASSLLFWVSILV
jgi:hypothetical protein